MFDHLFGCVVHHLSADGVVDHIDLPVEPDRLQAVPEPAGLPTPRGHGGAVRMRGGERRSGDMQSGDAELSAARDEQRTVDRGKAAEEVDEGQRWGGWSGGGGCGCSYLVVDEVVGAGRFAELELLGRRSRRDDLRHNTKEMVTTLLSCPPACHLFGCGTHPH